ncbi:MAG TPA: 1,2-phenylacetyl-CoA epoxidase subunit PaaD [Dehalococcoidia bacterium]|nr:1,2-phenylacetyl-CoA epoxidase subunit PaaD [Dehalococcoidia bacterium]
MPADDRDLSVRSAEEQIWQRLRDVPDPELPALSVVDLGMIRRVALAADEVTVELMPTFLGCPALDLIRDAIEDALAACGSVRVSTVRDEAWTSERITPEGREKLRAAGIAPPTPLPLQLMDWPVSPCPHCGGRSTRLESPFGPTPCRAIHYCRACRQPFEQFKAI